MRGGSKNAWVEPVADRAWLALRSEEVVDPQQRIVDPHHHLWAMPGQSYLLPQFLADRDTGHNVVATVYMEASMGYDPKDPSPLASAAEIDFALAARDASGGQVCTGIVSYINLRAGENVEEIIDAQIARGRGALKGVRDTVAWSEFPELRNYRIDPAKDSLALDSFVVGATAIGKAGLPVDLWLYQDQLDQLASTASRVPTTNFVVDHCGGPLMAGPYATNSGDRFAQWSKSINKLASLENVYIKLGGLGMRTVNLCLHERDRPELSERLAEIWRPYIDTCLEAFGPFRCMFESNFPVDGEVCTYRTVWNTFKRLARSFSSDERDRLFFGTAEHVYSLA